MNAKINPQSPESVELLDFIEATGNLSKHLRKVYEYAIAATACGKLDLPVETCGSLSFLCDFTELVEKVETN